MQFWDHIYIRINQDPEKKYLKDNNIRQEQNIVLANITQELALLYLIDPEKAFDIVMWLFPKVTIAKVNFVPCIMQWLSLIYHTQSAIVMLDGCN